MKKSVSKITDDINIKKIIGGFKMFEMLCKKMNKNEKGFTLIELIIVIAIIGILAAVLIPKFTGFTDKAKARGVELEARNIAIVLDSLIAEGDTDNYEVGYVAEQANVDEDNLVLDEENDGSFEYTKNGYIASRTAQGEIEVEEE